MREGRGTHSSYRLINRHCRARQSTRLQRIDGSPVSALRAGTAMTLPATSLHEPMPGDAFECLVIDLVTIGFGEIERLQNLDRIADVARSLFRIERAVGGEHHFVDRKEFQSDDGRRL